MWVGTSHDHSGQRPIPCGLWSLSKPASVAPAVGMTFKNASKTYRAANSNNAEISDTIEGCNVLPYESTTSCVWTACSERHRFKPSSELLQLAEVDKHHSHAETLQMNHPHQDGCCFTSSRRKACLMSSCVAGSGSAAREQITRPCVHHARANRDQVRRRSHCVSDDRRNWQVRARREALTQLLHNPVSWIFIQPFTRSNAIQGKRSHSTAVERFVGDEHRQQQSKRSLSYPQSR